jgi:TonB family protein
MKSPLVPLLLGLTCVALAVAIDVQRQRIQASDVADVTALRAQLDSVKAVATAVTSPADSVRLATSVADRTRLLARREFHVPSRQAAIDGWWAWRGPGTLLMACGALLVLMAVITWRRRAALGAVAAAAALAVSGASLAAQGGLVGGIAVDAASARPLSCVRVELLDASGRAVAAMQTRLGGDFEFAAPPRGDYRFRFSALGIAPVETVAEPLDPASDVERTFRVTLTLLDSLARAAQVAERDSTETPRFLASKGPRYPRRLRERRIEGEVIAGYAVTADGKVDARSMVPLFTSHPDFEDAVEHSLADLRFVPARQAGQGTCTFRAGTFIFRLDGPVGRIEVG